MAFQPCNRIVCQRGEDFVRASIEKNVNGGIAMEYTKLGERT